MQATATKKLTLAAGSVFFHAALIGWIFSGEASKSPRSHNPQQTAMAVFIVSPMLHQHVQQHQSQHDLAAQAPRAVPVHAARSRSISNRPQGWQLQQTQQTLQIPQVSTPFYFPVTVLDRRPVPWSEPDLLSVKEKPVTNRPITLRIYIDRFGIVDNVTPLSVDELDQDFMTAIVDIFRITRFLPGQMHGVDVATFIDIEVSNANLLRTAETALVPCAECIGSTQSLLPIEK